MPTFAEYQKYKNQQRNQVSQTDTTFAGNYNSRIKEDVRNDTNTVIESEGVLYGDKTNNYFTDYDYGLMNYTEDLDQVNVNKTPEGGGFFMESANFAGNLLGGFVDSALFGLPGLVDDLLFSESNALRELITLGAYDDYEDETRAGKWGYGIGSGLGMIVPFKAVGKGLNFAASKMWTAPNKSSLFFGSVYKTSVKQMGNHYMADYMKKEGGEQVLSAVQKIGGGVVDDASEAVLKEAFEKGYTNLMDDAYKLMQDPAYTKWFGWGTAGGKIADKQAILKKGIDEFAEGIFTKYAKQGMTQEMSQQLAVDIMQQATKHSATSFHTVTNLFGKKVFNMLGMRAPNAPVVTGGVIDYGGQVLGAMVSDFMIGTTMHTAEWALHNMTYFLASHSGLDNELWDDGGGKIDKKLVKERTAAGKGHENLHSSFLEALGHSAQSGLWMSFIGPTRFVRGGSNWGGRGMKAELQAGMNAIMRAWKPISKTSGADARFSLELIDYSSANMMSARTKVAKLLDGKQIKDLSDDVAVDVLKQVRRDFSAEYSWWFLNEARADLLGSSGRMIAGLLAMNAPGIYQQMAAEDGNIARAFGNDGDEIAQNIIIGMIFSKSGRSFNTGGKSLMWEKGDLRQYYSANHGDMMKMRSGLELIGMNTSDWALGSNNHVHESHRTIIKDQPLFSDVDRVIKDYIVRETETIGGRDTPQNSFKKYLNETLGLKEGTPEYEMNMENFKVAEEVIQMYMDKATDVGEMFRTVTPEEAYTMVNEISQMNHFKNPKKVTTTLDSALQQGYHEANLLYKGIRRDYILSAMKALGREVETDPATGNIIMPNIDRKDLQSLFPEGTSLTKETHSNIAIREFYNVIDQGIADGWIKLDGAHTISKTPKSQVGFVDSFMRGKEAMLVHIYGAKNVKNGAYTGEWSILSSTDMNVASVGIDNATQVFNVLSLLTHNQGNVGEIFNTIPKDKRQRVLELIANLRLDQNPIIKYGELEPQKYSEDMAFFGKLQETFRLLNQKGGSDKTPIHIDQVNQVRQELRQIVGDIFEKSGESRYVEIRNHAIENFAKNLKMIDSHVQNSTILATEVLMRGGIDLSTRNSTDRMVSRFVDQTRDGLVMPKAQLLFEYLKNQAPDKIKLSQENGLEEFYLNLEANLSKSGGVIKFTGQLKDIQRIVDTMGPDKVIELLYKAKMQSDLGSISDLMKTSIPLETMAKRIMEIKAAWIAKGVDKQDEFFEYLDRLASNTMGFNQVIRFAMHDRNYKILANINNRRHTLNDYIGQTQRFLGIEIEKMPNIDATYKKDLIEQVSKIENFLRKDYGEINLENYGEYVKDKIAQHGLDPLEHHMENMLVNITSGQFEARYGMTPLAVARIVKPHIDRYQDAKAGATGDISTRTDRTPQDYLRDAYDALLVEVNAKNKTLPKGKRKEAADITVDVFQTVLQQISVKEVSKVKWKNGYFEVSKDYLLNQDNVGPLALMKNLGLKDQFYLLDQTIEFMDNQGRYIVTANPTEAELKMIGEQMLTKTPTFESPKDKLDNLRGIVQKDLQQQSLDAKYMHIALGEGNNIVVNVEYARRAVGTAFGIGGFYRNRLEQLFAPGDIQGQKFIADTIKDLELAKHSKDIEKGILLGRLLTDAPHIVKEMNTGQKFNIDQLKDIWKRLKMPVLTKGRIFTPEVLDFTESFYGEQGRGVAYFDNVYNVMQTFKNPDGTWRKMRAVSIDDGAAGSAFNSQTRFKSWLELNQDLFSPSEAIEILSKHESSAKSGVDAATYVTREAFIMHLSQIGIRPEMIHWNKKGEIIGFKTGAIKPKGVHVEVNDKGGIQVWYDKTAIFYDAKVDGLLKNAGLDILAFKSGNKVNKFSEDNSTVPRERFVNSDMTTVNETMFGDLSAILGMRINQADVIDLPLSTFNVTNVARPHLAKGGANLGVHLHHDVEMTSWLRLDSKVDAFRSYLHQSLSNDFAMTQLARDLSRSKAEDGDLLIKDSPLDHILDNNGVIMDKWMGDMVADKLFTYFFEGSKIATSEVGNSSISPMAPPLHQKLSFHDMAIRTSSSVETSDGRVINISRQKIIGDYTPDGTQLDQQFSFYNVVGSDPTGKNITTSTKGETGFFIIRAPYNLGKEVVRTIGTDGSIIESLNIADFVVTPWKTTKGGETKFKIVGNGYELLPDRLIDLNNINENGVAREIMVDNQALYRDMIGQIEGAYGELWNRYTDPHKIKTNNLTNRDVIEFLARRYPGKDNGIMSIKLGMLNNRQPRNIVNDVVINKVSAEVIERTLAGDKDSKVRAISTKTEIGDNWREGNQSKQNLVDAIETQDSDYDYDKSSSFGSVPPRFLYDVAKKSGYGLSSDPYTFAEKFFRELDLRLDDNHSLKQHLVSYNNSAFMRGRIVKLHNIVSYMMNSFRGTIDNRTLGSFTEGNVKYNIRMKPDSDYFLTADNIGRWAKIFIDNYDNPTKSFNTETLVQDILFGKADAGKNGRHYEGLFELVDASDATKRIPFIDKEHAQLRVLLYNRFIGPTSRYLRYNRGMTEQQQGQSQSLTLKDIAAGYNSLAYELNNPHLNLDMNGEYRKFTVNTGKGPVYEVDLGPGIKTLSDYILGGKDPQNPSTTASQNPFDVAMRTLKVTYDQMYNNGNKQRNLSTLDDILMKAEAGVFLDAEGLSRDYDRTTLSKALFEWVQADAGYIEIGKLSHRIESLKKDRDFMNMNKYSNKGELELLEQRILELSDLKSRLEIMIGYQYDYENGSQVTIGNMSYERGAWKNLGKDVVYWKNGKMVGVVKNGERNGFKIENDMVGMVDGRRFELSNPKLQEHMHAKNIAFGTLPFEMLKDGQYITMTEQQIRVSTNRPMAFVYREYARLKQLLRGTKDKTGRMIPGITPAEYATSMKAVINSALQMVKTPLERKALIWMMLKPEANTKVIAYRKSKDGRHINENAFYENPLAKSMWRLLVDIHKGESFQNTPDGAINNISKLEAKTLIDEIVQRQTLAHLGVDAPYLEVNIRHDFGEFGSRQHRELWVELNHDMLHSAVKETGIDGQFALDRLNEFMAGERLVTPAEMKLLADKFKLSDGLIFLTHETDQSIPPRPKRNYGRTINETPQEMVKRFNEQNRRIQKKQCPTN